MRYAPGLGLARALGLFSIGLGLAELFAPDAVARLTGVHHRGLLQLYGLRELAAGLGILASDRPVGWVGGRVAGDAVDLATLAAVLFSSRGEDRTRALGAALAVAGVTALDVMATTQLGAAAALEG